MKVGIITVGNELLNGHTVDTNTAWLSGELFQLGIETIGSWTVPDEKGRIIQSLIEASNLCNLIIVSGGLGPTEDDLTRQAVASFLGVELEFKEDLLTKIKSFFQGRGKEMAAGNRSQAYIPVGSEVLDNPWGTAPGFWSTKERVNIAVVPGVPAEMKRMFTGSIVPRIASINKETVVISGKVRCFGIGESDLAQKVGDLMERGRNPLINCTCGSGDLVLHIIARAKDKATAAAMVDNDRVKLKKLLDQWIYSFDDHDLPSVVGGLLKKNRKTIALAESCTGGLLSKLITDIPGASEYFLGSWVTYSNEAKIKYLGIPEEIILENGAVSEPVARAMAESAARTAGAEIGIGITGVAGPGGSTEEKPVGLVYIGVYIDDKCYMEKCRFPSNNRDWIRHRSALTALNMVRLRLKV